MRMLLIIHPEEVDQAVVFVEDGYSRKEAEQLGADFLGSGAYISEDVGLDFLDIPDLPSEFCTWRPYIG